MLSLPIQLAMIDRRACEWRGDRMENEVLQGRATFGMRELPRIAAFVVACLMLTAANVADAAVDLCEALRTARVERILKASPAVKANVPDDACTMLSEAGSPTAATVTLRVGPARLYELQLGMLRNDANLRDERGLGDKALSRIACGAGWAPNVPPTCGGLFYVLRGDRTIGLELDFIRMDASALRSAALQLLSSLPKI